MKISLPPIHHSLEGFEALVSFHKETRNCLFGNVEIDMSAADWVDADMCAVLGALLYRLGETLNTVSLTKLSAKVEKALSKNGFLSHYGREKIPDRHGTTVSYQRFDAEDERYFSEYLGKELINRPEIPEMSPELLKKFHESIFEIFSNAVSHSDTDLGIFSCGQFYPHRERLDFTVADLGVGIRAKVTEHRSMYVPPEEAIDWATQSNNTTRRGRVPGGLGLKLLCEFIDLNGGCILIVSDAGYWKRAGGQTEKMALSHPFPGTAVSVEINTGDTQSYGLESGLTEEEIF